MTLSDFFLAVNAAGIRLTNVGGQLELRGPANALTEEIRAAAAEHKEAVLSLLSPPAVIEDASGEPMGSGPAVSADGFRHDHDWRDWRLEWLLELGTLYLRIRSCQEPDVLARLRPLAEAMPATRAEWLAVARQIVNTEYELAQGGKLPSFRWPERGDS